VNAYDISLTRTIPTALSVARRELPAITLGDFAIFGGGHSAYGASSVVDIYDTSLTRTTGTSLSAARYNSAATIIGNYALFGGGNTGSYSSVVDAYVYS
jgi:hypothetical protein